MTAWGVLAVAAALMAAAGAGYGWTAARLVREDPRGRAMAAGVGAFAGLAAWLLAVLAGLAMRH